MKKLVLVAMLGLVACGDSPQDVETFDPNILNGTWTATLHTFTNDGGSYDVVATGGETRMTVLDGNRSRTWLEWPQLSVSDEFDSRLVITDGFLTGTPVEAGRDAATFEWTLADGVLTLTGVGTVGFTSTTDPEVPSSELITMSRN